MLEIGKNEIFNRNTLNIFTDASVKVGDRPVACTGYQSYINTSIVDTNTQYVETSSPDIAELNAIKMGILSAIRIKNSNPKVTSINLFSDSRNCILWLKEITWFNSTSSGVLKIPKNIYKEHKIYLLDIVDLIILNRLEINLYYIKGHYNRDDLTKFKNSFVRINELSFTITDDLAALIVKNNTVVDNMVYTKLMDIPENRIQRTYPQVTTNRFNLIINADDYKTLINKKGVLL